MVWDRIKALDAILPLVWYGIAMGHGMSCGPLMGWDTLRMTTRMMRKKWLPDTAGSQHKSRYGSSSKERLFFLKRMLLLPPWEPHWESAAFGSHILLVFQSSWNGMGWDGIFQ